MGTLEIENSNERWIEAAVKLTALTRQNKIVWKLADVPPGYGGYGTEFEGNHLVLTVAPIRPSSQNAGIWEYWNRALDTSDRDLERISLTVTPETGPSFPFFKVSALKGLVRVVQEQLVEQAEPFLTALSKA